MMPGLFRKILAQRLTVSLYVIALLVTGINFAQARDGGTAVFGARNDPGHFNPGITTGYNVHIVADSMFNGLVAMTRDLNPAPDLAASWSVNESSTAYTFNLQPNVLWHDGKNFTAADVKFTFEKVKFLPSCSMDWWL